MNCANSGEMSCWGGADLHHPPSDLSYQLLPDHTTQLLLHLIISSSHYQTQICVILVLPCSGCQNIGDILLSLKKGSFSVMRQQVVTSWPCGESSRGGWQDLRKLLMTKSERRSKRKGAYSGKREGESFKMRKGPKICRSCSRRRRKRKLW